MSGDLLGILVSPRPYQGHPLEQAWHSFAFEPLGGVEVVGVLGYFCLGSWRIEVGVLGTGGEPGAPLS